MAASAGPEPDHWPVDMPSSVSKPRSAYLMLILLWVSWADVDSLTPDDPDGLYRSTGTAWHRIVK